MHIASLGVSKFCFLLSLAFCGFLLLVIPVLHPPACQVDPPKPRAQVRPAQTEPSSPVWFLEVSANETRFADEHDSSSVGKGEVTSKDGNERTPDSKDKTVLGGGEGGPSGSRILESLQLKDIFIAVKTTKKYHRTRLELLIETWISKAKEQVRVDYWDGGHCSASRKQALVISSSSQLVPSVT